MLLVGPYDPHCGEYTFLAPPLGVWRLQGVLSSAGVDAHVFDPNLSESPAEALRDVLAKGPWDVVGISTTGMTLQFDLSLAHQAKREVPNAVLVAGGMEATFRPELMFELCPFDLVVLGEGEGPMFELTQALKQGGETAVISGVAYTGLNGDLIKKHRAALDADAFKEAVFATPYADMPYAAYWERLEDAYRIDALPHKAAREARLAEVRSVRLITLNYCPMGCSFCSSTNFLHSAQGGTAKVRRLSASEILDMLARIVKEQPGVRTVIFQDDIFVFTKDDRILPLCSGIEEAKRSGVLPQDLEFISTNRIDAMTPERLRAMRAAGFRVLGFGVESFSTDILKEFKKARIEPFIEPHLSEALSVGITPFLDLILTSPRCSMDDLTSTIRSGFRWLLEGCEMGMYPYVIPFSGAEMAEDESLEPHTISTRRRVVGTTVSWLQPVKILPIDPEVREVILAMEHRFSESLVYLEAHVAHLPSRIRSLLWILAASVELGQGHDLPDADEVREQLLKRLPLTDPRSREDLRVLLTPSDAAKSAQHPLVAGAR